MPETTDPQAGTETTTDEKQPPWTAADFDAERAWKKMQALEADKARLTERAAKAKTPEEELALAEYGRLVEASKSELDRKNEELTRWQTEAERWRSASVTNRIEALAGQDFADPSDAAAALPDPSKYIDAGGVINEAAIKADLAAVLEKKPHWRRQEPASGPRAPFPNPAQGAGGTHTPNPVAEFTAILQGLDR